MATYLDSVSGSETCQFPTLHSIITGIAFLKVLSQVLFFPPRYTLALFVSDFQICFSRPSLFPDFQIHISNGNSVSLLEWLKDFSNSIYPTELVIFFSQTSPGTLPFTMNRPMFPVFDARIFKLLLDSKCPMPNQVHADPKYFLNVAQSLNLHFYHSSLVYHNGLLIAHTTSFPIHLNSCNQRNT